MMKTILGIILVATLGLGIISKVLLTHFAVFGLAFILTPLITIWTLIELLFNFFMHLGIIDWKEVITNGTFKKRISGEH